MHSRTISAATRDSIATEKLSAVPGIAARTRQTAEAKEQLRQQMEPGLPAYGRAARLPGYAASVPLMNGGYSIAVTAVSHAGHLDRTARDAIDADYQLRLRRLQDRALLRRDSTAADSLRTDSLPRKPGRREPFVREPWMSVHRQRPPTPCVQNHSSVILYPPGGDHVW